MINSSHFLFRILVFISLHLSCGFSKGISQSISSVNYEVYENEKLLLNPWVGGLNNPQFSFFDLTGNNKKEMIVFDRLAETLSVFVEEEGDWHYDFLLSNIFPKARRFFLLRDFNLDGIPDIFTYANPEPVNGISVYKGNINEQGKIVFDKMDLNSGNSPNILHFNSLGSSKNIYLAPTDLPVLDDIDGDGDLDILAFEPSGGRLWFYRNLSVEKGLSLDSFYFIREDPCWGKFIEGPDFENIILSESPDLCAHFLNGAIETRHAGSNLLAYDFSGNGLKDLLITDIDVSEMKVLLNNGTHSRAWITQVLSDFPPKYPVNLSTFPAAFLAPSAHGNLKDLIISPGAEGFLSEDIEVAWYYQKNLSEDPFDYSLLRKDFLVSDMLDFGTGSSPVLVDVTGNGLMDIVVGVHSRFEENSPNGLLSFLVLMENIGSSESPKFVVSDRDWLGLSSFGKDFFGFRPTFGDLDGDGDLDLLIGTSQGDHIFLENISSVGRRMRFSNPVFNPFSIPKIRNSSPCIVDVEGDGLKDLLIGDFLGRVHFYKNIGTLTDPTFDSDVKGPNSTNFFSSIDVRESPVPGHASPYFFSSKEGNYLILGRRDEGILIYKNEKDLEDYVSIGKIEGTEFTGKYTGVALHDLDNDGYLEMVVGNIRGGLQLLKTNFSKNDFLAPERIFKDNFSLFPNPAHEKIFINYENAKIDDRYSIEIKDIRGATLLEMNNISLYDLYEIDVSFFPSGIYAVLIFNKKINLSSKVIINR